MQLLDYKESLDILGPKECFASVGLGNTSKAGQLGANPKPTEEIKAWTKVVLGI